MKRHATYLGFGALVLLAYWLTVRGGHVYWSDDVAPSAQAERGVAGHGPTFWSTGYQGGK